MWHAAVLKLIPWRGREGTWAAFTPHPGRFWGGQRGLQLPTQRGSGAARGAPRWAGCQQMALQSAQTRSAAQMPPEMASPAPLQQLGAGAGCTLQHLPPQTQPLLCAGLCALAPRGFPQVGNTSNAPK